MQDDGTRSILERLTSLERNTCVRRLGEVTAVSPLSVDVGASGTAWLDVPALTSAGRLDIGDTVVCLLVGGVDLIVLGRAGGGGGNQEAGPSGSRASVVATLVALTSGPSLTVQESGTYIVRVECGAGTTGAGVTGLRVALLVGGVEHGSANSEQGYFVAQTTNDGGRFAAEWDQALTAGQVLTLGVASTGGIAATFSGGFISIRPVR